jgi:ATP phosphoribosyltransferase
VADPDRSKAMTQLKTLLDGAMDARGRVLVKVNVAREQLDAVIAALPAMKSPTVNELFGGEGYAIESVVPKSRINTLIPQLKDLGATDIIELPILKIVP